MCYTFHSLVTNCFILTDKLFDQLFVWITYCLSQRFPLVFNPFMMKAFKTSIVPYHKFCFIWNFTRERYKILIIFCLFLLSVDISCPLELLSSIGPLTSWFMTWRNERQNCIYRSLLCLFPGSGTKRCRGDPLFLSLFSSDT